MKVNNPNYLNGLTVSAEQINAAVEGGGAGLTPEQTTTLGKIDGLNSSASEIDGSISRDKQTIVILGDSLIAQDKADSNQSSSFGIFTWANALSGNKFTLLNNAGVGGENSSQILARVDSAVIPYNPTHCMFTCGMNNDTSPSSTIILQNDIIAIYNKLNNAGIFSIILTNMPKTSDIQMTKRALAMLHWMEEYFKNLPNCIIVNTFKIVISPNATDGSVIANSYRDDRHQSNYGAYLIGYELAKYFNKFNDKFFLTSSALDTFLLNEYSLNRIKNPLFLGTTGTKDAYSSGDVATSVNITGSSTVSNVCSLIPRADGFGNYQKIVMTKTATANGESATIYLDADKTGIVVGDKFYAMVEILVYQESTNFSNPTVGLEINNSTVKRSFLSNYTPAKNILLKDNITTLIVKTDTCINSIDNPFGLRIKIAIGMTADAGTTSFTISRASIVKVN